MTTSPNRTVDHLIEGARRFADITDWGLDSLGGNGVYSDEHTELELISDALPPLNAALRAFDHYSDGRAIQSRVRIEDGLVFGHTWPAEPCTSGERLLSEARLSVDPGQPDRGGYRVWAHDTVCRLRVEYLPVAPNLVLL